MIFQATYCTQPNPSGRPPDRDVLPRHADVTRRDAPGRAVSCCAVGITDPARRAKAYPSKCRAACASA
jgi:hypothetical protein